MLRNKGKGQGLVEFALILPILLMLLLGIVEGGRIIWAYVTVQNAAREATRYAVTGRPFACGGDPVDPVSGTPNSGNPLDPTHYCDDPIEGVPWSPQVLTSTRVAAIKNVAVEQGQNLAVRLFAKDDVDQYVANESTPGAFGIAVVGQSAVYSQGLANYAGEPGWNVQVSTYYNVEMIDPIFRVIMGPVPIHLTGRVELQNEGIDATVKEYIGGIPPYFIDNCVEAGTCGSGSVPYISVQDDFSDFSEPAGGRFTVSVNDHTPATDYILHFTNGGFNQTIPFRTDSLGGKLITVLISVSAPATAGGPDYKIYTSEASDAGQTPVATCLGDGATNAPCFSVTSGSPTIIARNVDDDDRDQKQQPLNINPARWPISSSIPIYLFGHNPNSSYRIMFDDQLSSAAPGTLWFQGTSVTQIPTDASFGTNEDNEPGYYIATGYSPGVGLTIASNDGSSDIATTEVDLIEAGIDIQGETSSITTTHPQDDVVGVVIRNLAPQQQYQVFVDDGISPNQIFRANDNGEVSLSYRVPYNSHNPGDPPKKVEIYALDYGRGTNDNKIASRWIWLWTDADPYINVPGGARWPAGTPITIQLRRHLANTEYEVYVQKGSAASPSFSELINGSSITTFENPQTGLGEYDISYTLPFTLDGFYTIRSFLPSDLTNPVAEYEIEVTANPHISVDGGIRWAAGTEVTIRLRGHAANTPYQVWLDRDGPQETFIGTVLVDGAGEGTIQYTIPQDMPSQVEPGYPIYSYLNDSITADDGELEVAELDLVVTRIDVPVVTFDIEIPVEVTIQNQGDVTTTATLFDTDIYVDPETPPSLSSALPPGDYKTWVGSVPPGGEVTIDESIVLFGQETHELYARTDTSDQIIETDELNNMLLKVVDAACPVTLVDEFNDSIVGAEWAQTDFGDSGPGCTPPADLPPVSTGGGTVVLERTWDNSGNPEGFQPVFDFLNEGLPTPSNYQITSSGSYGNPNYSLYVGPQGDTGGSTSVGGYIDFNLSSASDVTINFDYGPAIRELDTNDWAEYYFLLDGTAYTQTGQDTYLARIVPTSNNSTNYPDNPSKWTSFSRTFNNLSAGSHRIIFGAKASSLENGTNERVYLYADNLTVTTVSSGSGAPPADPTGTLWSTHFNSGVESFAFAKDTFITPGSRYTDGSGNDESQGSRVTDTGAWGDGALQVRLGLVDGQTTPANNMSGGWSRDFTVGTADNCVTVQGYYRIHVPFNAYEGNEEFGEVLLSVDGGLPQVIFNTQSLSDPDNNNQDYDSGWVPFSVTIPDLTATTHTLTLGGFNNRATWSDEKMEIWFDDVYVVENTAGAATSSQGESNDLLTLTNRGSSALTGDDNGTGAGYHLMHQTVGTGPFEMYVRVDAAPNNGSLGLAGLEIRGDETNGTSGKIMFVHRSDGRLKIYSRVNGSGQTIDKQTQFVGGGPVWIRIQRNGQDFEFSYAANSSDTRPTNWNSLYTLTGFVLPDNVQVGLINAPASSSTTYDAEFKHFHVCASSAPGGSGSSGQGYLGSRCGQVEENGNGLVVIDAVNTILNVSGGSGGVWQAVTVDDVLGEPSLEGLEATADRPHATYQVNIESSGTFNVWVAGWTSASGNPGVDVGRFGTVIGTVTGFPSGGNSPGWVKLTGSVDLTPGIYTFDLWGKAGDLRVFKILLTSDANFIPPPDGMAQSACTVIAQPHIPPLLRQCINPLRRGDFEGTFTEVTGEWTTRNLASAYGNVKYEGNHGSFFPTFGDRKPLISQAFDLPTWILTGTTAVLDLHLGADLNYGGTTVPSDTLNFALRRESDGFDLITPVQLVDVTDPSLPDMDSTNPAPTDWIRVNQDILSGLNPLSFLEPGDNVRAFFYSPDDGQGTGFFVDSISLTFCTTQPEPEQEPDKGRISGRTQRASQPLVGATVWAYAFAEDGSTPGPVSKTYSIQDGTYRFYNLQPGIYLVYAEIVDAGGTFSDVRLVEVRAGTEVRNVILNLQTG